MRQSNLPTVTKAQVKSSMLVYGPFVDSSTLQHHCYTDYLEVCGADNLRFEEYKRLFTDLVRRRRSYAREVVAKIRSCKRMAPIHPTLPTPKSADETRTLAYNLHWMLDPPTDGGTARRIHPFLAQVVRKAMAWTEGNGFAAVDSQRDRINTRVARVEGGESNVVTLHQLAPVIVLTIATFASIGIVSHLGIDWNRLPPLEQFYSEVMTALNDRDGVLGDAFVEDCRALVDQLYESVAEHARLTNLPRDPESGLLLVAHIKREE
ncbi:hypothetical protein H9P43_006778 [Blastocladiella emersonii ATCC 22665]|nr:hypothetical protein H9P43_006778 [Blastocladiella emersonii ATCC 22665]